MTRFSSPIILITPAEIWDVAMYATIEIKGLAGNAETIGSSIPIPF